MDEKEKFLRSARRTAGINFLITFLPEDQKSTEY